MAKPKSYEEALEQFKNAREALKEAKTTKREFMKEHKIKKDVAPEDAAVAKKWDKLLANVEKAQEEVEEYRSIAKDLKPKKERVTKYDYPDDMDDKEKKKYRAKMRKEAKKEEKEPGEEKKGNKKILKKTTFQDED